MLTAQKCAVNISQECADFSIGMNRYDVMDNFSFDLNSVAKKSEGVIAVFPKITVLTSRDRKFVGVEQK